MSRRRSILAGFAAVAVAAGAGVIATGGSRSPVVEAVTVADDSGSVAPPPTGPFPRYPVNERGETYGSATQALTPEQDPDLILAYGTKGQEGYVRKTDLNLPVPRTPEEAVELSRRNPPRMVPLYSRDGVTVIGEYEMATARSSDSGQAPR